MPLYFKQKEKLVYPDSGVDFKLQLVEVVTWESYIRGLEKGKK